MASPEVTVEAHEALQAVRADLVAEAPDGASPDPFEAEAAVRKAKAKGEQKLGKSN